MPVGSRCSSSITKSLSIAYDNFKLTKSQKLTKENIGYLNEEGTIVEMY